MPSDNPTWEQRYNYQRLIADQASDRAAVFQKDFYRMVQAAKTVQARIDRLISTTVIDPVVQAEVSRMRIDLDRALGGMEPLP